ncbi:MAG: hypothetical protein K940chlam6_00794, partial [Chlamydiae bacterium]|nr:hypothetical protein [Chlamydiota bacterium]
FPQNVFTGMILLHLIDWDSHIESMGLEEIHSTLRYLPITL